MKEPFTNRLIHEKSPYLQQHAHNPVDWYPWGEEAFHLAKELDRPIFLSIGYATCHWCHVMERESFENEELAKMLNDSFVNVKVDREELPEVDSIYMECAQALMATAGGWPLNVLLTPDLKPFFATTYLPPKTSRGMIGLDQFILQIKQLWQSEERPYIVEQADKIVDIFKRSAHLSGDTLPSEELLTQSAHALFDGADPVYGGFKGEPKFPLGFQAWFFMQLAKEEKEGRALFFVELSLDKMASGGMYDHLGGGFSRYTIDAAWQIPHFEKMLYDNALLARTYLEGWRLLKKERYAAIVKETADYLLREMRSEEGGFYSAEDADTEGKEGLFYTWTLEEIEKVVPEEIRELFCAFYAVTPFGNFEGRNILHMHISLEAFAEQRGLSEVELDKRLKEARHLLFEARETRKRPHKDRKILSGWNGLVIDLLAQAGIAFQDKRYLQAATQAAQFIKDHLWKEGSLLRRYCDKEARFSASLEDYAYLIKGLITLFEVGEGLPWLSWAMEMTQVLSKKFKAHEGAFYQTEESRTLLFRRASFYDAAEPSGNGVHLENLLRLFQMSQEESYLKEAEDILKSAKNFIEAYPLGACYHLAALQRYFNKAAPTFVVAVGQEKEMIEPLLTHIYTRFLPHLALVWKKEGEELDSLLPHLKDKIPIDGKTTLYLCKQTLCEAPIMDKQALLQAIETL